MTCRKRYFIPMRMFIEITGYLSLLFARAEPLGWVYDEQSWSNLTLLGAGL